MRWVFLKEQLYPGKVDRTFNEESNQKPELEATWPTDGEGSTKPKSSFKCPFIQLFLYIFVQKA